MKSLHCETNKTKRISVYIWHSAPLRPGDPGVPRGPGIPGTPGVPMSPISPFGPADYKGENAYKQVHILKIIFFRRRHTQTQRH